MFLTGTDVKTFSQEGKRSSKSVTIACYLDIIGPIRIVGNLPQRKVTALMYDSEDPRKSRSQILRVCGKRHCEDPVFKKRQMAIMKGLVPTTEKDEGFVLGTNFLSEFIPGEVYSTQEVVGMNTILEMNKLSTLLLRVEFDDKAKESFKKKRRNKGGSAEKQKEDEEFAVDLNENDDGEDYEEGVYSYEGFELPVRVSKMDELENIEDGELTNLCGRVFSFREKNFISQGFPKDITNIDIRSLEEGDGQIVQVTSWNSRKDDFKIEKNDVVLIKNAIKKTQYQGRSQFDLSDSGTVEVIEKGKKPLNPKTPTKPVSQNSMSGNINTTNKKKRQRENNFSQVSPSGVKRLRIGEQEDVSINDFTQIIVDQDDENEDEDEDNEELKLLGVDL